MAGNPFLPEFPQNRGILKKLRTCLRAGDVPVQI